DRMQLFYMPLTYIVVSVPFSFGGLALSFLFTRFSAGINRLYAFDLAGAALGCVAVIFTMTYFGGGGSVLLASVFAAVASVISFSRTYKRQSALAAVIALISFLFAFQSNRFIPLRITDNKAKGLRKLSP